MIVFIQFSESTTGILPSVTKLIWSKKCIKKCLCGKERKKTQQRPVLPVQFDCGRVLPFQGGLEQGSELCLILFTWAPAAQVLQPQQKAVGKIGAREDGAPPPLPALGRAAARLDGAWPVFTDFSGLFQICPGVSRRWVNWWESSTSSMPVLEKPVNLIMPSLFAASALQKWENQLLKVLCY